MTSVPLTTQRLYAYIVASPRRSLTSRLATMLGRADLPSRQEFAELRPATRVLIVALGAWIGMVVLATLLGVAWAEMSTTNFSAQSGAGVSASAGGETRSPVGFENILQRPLFSRSRQAPAAAAVAMAPSIPAAMQDQSVALKGVFISGGLAKAFMTSSQTPQGVWVQAEEDIAGWRLVAVEPDRVLLRAGSEKLVVPLSNSSGAK